MKKVAFYFLLVLLSTSRGWGQGQNAPLSEEQPLELNYSLPGGFYEDEVVVRLEAPAGAKIYYTTDGSQPTKRSAVFNRSLRIRSTTVLRAVAYLGAKNSLLKGQTYFIKEPSTTFPVVSVALAPYQLFDPEKGLFMQGSRVVDSLWSKPGANFWSRVEVPVHMEIYEPDGSCAYSSPSGFRLFGGMSRLFPQKSFAIVARKRYGETRIRHRVFGEDGLKRFKYLVFRNGGSDFGKTHFRDALMTRLVEDWDIDKQDYRPAHVYLNGEYWGIYNIREKVNRFFIADHHDIDPDSIDLIEHYMSLKTGSKRSYLELLQFLENNDLSDPANYAYVHSLMEMDNFMNYQIAQIYFDNQDAGGNIKFWRPQTPGGRWRWILFDTDWGFGLHDEKAYRNNSLAFHTEPNGPRWPNPPWSTFILRKLLENPAFREAFLNRFADHLNSCFSPEHVGQVIDELYSTLKPEIPRHHERWRLSHEKWDDQVELLRTFARKRPAYVWRHLKDRFDAGDLGEVEISIEGGGFIMVNNNVHISEAEFHGQYFERIPISIEAVPHFGYRFSHWEGIKVDRDMRKIHLHVKKGQPYRIRAVFERYTHPLAGKVMINEVSPNNKKSGDWVEIFNFTDEKINLRNWLLADKKNAFLFPDVTIAANDYLVVCQDSSKFYEVFPRAYNVVSGLSFGLNKRKEIIGLYTADGAVIDSLSYELEPTDSTFTLSLLLPYLDNSDPENWELKWGTGTPNAANPYYVESSIRQVQEQWMQIGVAAGVVLVCMLLLFLRHRGR